MKVVGLSGLASSGKDLFFDIAQKILTEKGMTCLRKSLGDILKTETRTFIKDHYNIDIFECSREDKNSVRPFLVTHGSILRKRTNGRYFLDKMNDMISREVWMPNLELKPDVLFITDIRYAEYENDEVFWLKNELKGKLIHIKQFQIITNKYGLKQRIYVEPPNQEERIQDPILQQEADEHVDWERVKSNQVNQVLAPIVEASLKKVLD